MDHDLTASEARLATHEALSKSLGHADRAGPLKHYCTGLLLPGKRKSVVVTGFAIPAVTAPAGAGILRAPAAEGSL